MGRYASVDSGLGNSFEDKQIVEIGAGKASMGIVIVGKVVTSSVVRLELVLRRLRTALIWREHVPNMQLVCGNVFSLPFQHKSFDFIIANSFLHHLPSIREGLLK